MNIVIDMPVFGPMLEKLKSLPNINVRLVENPEEKVRTLPSELVRDCDALFCTFPPENHQEIENLKFIQISSAGYTQLIGKGFPERNVSTANALGVFDIPIAEWSIAMMINLARDVPQMIHNQDNGIWDRSARFQHEIRDSIVGVWGYGGIGRETTRLAKALGMKVHVLTRAGIKERSNTYFVDGTSDPEGLLPDKVFTMANKNEFFKDLDFLVLAIPQTKENEGIMDESDFAQLKNSVFLLNPARGPLINEKALTNALLNKQIAGAALDTHYYYPMPPEHPFWKMPNVILTPHISGSSASPKFLERVWDIFVKNIIRLQNGEPLLNELRQKDLK
jgi:phosphoglycerate dehydrogenase-like enzyme